MNQLVKVSDLFNIKYGSNLALNALTQCEDSDNHSINFVSRTDKNNGVSAHVKKIPKKDTIPANTISVAAGGSVMSSFFQPEPYYSGRDVYVLSPNHQMSPQEMIYYTLCLTANKYRYNYGRQANKTLGELMIPSNIPNEFKDVNFNDLCNINKNSIIKKETSLNPTKWKSFVLSDLFEIKKGKAQTKENLINGSTPLIASIEGNNGVRQYIAMPPTFDKNTITVSGNGSIGEAFYHSQPYCASSDVNVLSPKFKLNKYIALFITTIIYKEKYRFNYGRKWNLERMNESTIKLPSTQSGEPDFEFMENYIKSLPYSASL
jgi:hypothetical protein